VTGYLREALKRRVSVSARKALGIFLLAVAMGACRKPAREPVTLSYLRLGWSQPDEMPVVELLSQKFMRETGIRLKNVPVPENTLDQLELSRKFLESGSGPDVLGIDVIWPGVLDESLMDLRPYFAAELATMEPQLVASYTVGGKLVAIPYQVQVGVLEYRTDLLREYGYKHPPATWAELQSMAERIQAGERAKGKKDFWGYVWQGASAEALTCNALEWQLAEGGGRIIESDHTISVNNPAAIRAWQRAKRWIGWISPPSVVAYREFDSMAVFDAGGAAFDRVWAGAAKGAKIAGSGQSRLTHWRNTLPFGKTGYTSMPGGPGGRAGTLGGSGLAVFRNTIHPKEAVELVRFLIHAQTDPSEKSTPDNLPAQPEVYDLASVLGPQSNSEKSSQHKSGLVSRPSNVTGSAYEKVARAYFTAVHAVLTGQTGAPEAAAELEKQLIAITGFTTGPPKTAE